MVEEGSGSKHIIEAEPSKVMLREQLLLKKCVVMDNRVIFQVPPKTTGACSLKKHCGEVEILCWNGWC